MKSPSRGMKMPKSRKGLGMGMGMGAGLGMGLGNFISIFLFNLKRFTKLQSKL